LLPADTPRIGEIALNARVLFFTGGLALLTGLVFGIIPALRISSTNVNSAMTAGGRSGVGSSQRRLSRALVIGEIAAAVVLVVAATLLVRSVNALDRGDPGFRVESIVTARISPPSGAYKDTNVIARFYEDLLNRAQSIPGVDAAGVVSEVPFAAGYGGAYRIAGQFEDITGKTGYLPMSDHSLVVSSAFFTAIGIPLIAGRTFNSTDRGGAPQVAIVSESFAKKFWPTSSAIGQRIGYPWPSDWVTIVGIARDAKLDSLTGVSEQTVYRPLAQAPRGAMSLILRAHSDQLAIGPAVRAAVAQIDRAVPVSDVRTMAQVAASHQARPRFTMALLAIFAGIALLLGVVGIYGLMSYSVAQRQREVGIRMALGASPGDAQRMVLGEGMKLAAIGIGIGLVVALSTTRLLSGFLYGVTSTDPVTFALATVTLAFVALAASYVPALRATKVDPTTALRAE
jgi:predicted permease